MEVFGGELGSKLEVLIPFRTAYAHGRWMHVFALAKSPSVADEARAEISFFLRQTRSIKPGEPDTFRIEVIARVIEVFNKIAAIITSVASGIVAISLVVGGIGIMNIMLVSVSERTREIGLRKAVGARPSAILLQFLVEAVMLCLVGGLIGLAGGELLTLAFSKGTKNLLEKAYIPGWAIVLSFGFSAAVGLFFGMFPAIKAARLDPIEALRHE
jgi:putative ABC transport system permease protein